ncbi:MAG: BtrH N-terminal domain-containing protein [bacterium]
MDEKETLVVKDFKFFGGKHCQTAALKNILDYRGLHFTEELLLGLGGGIGFIYWFSKKMPFPFIGGRNSKVDEFVLKICSRIGASAVISKTSSEKKAHGELKEALRRDEPAYLFADMAYLPYFEAPEETHFGGHTVAVFGVDEKTNKVFISDRGRKRVTVSVDDLKKARGSKFPPFPSENKMLKMKCPSKQGNLKKGIEESAVECCLSMMKPPIRNFGLAGMEKWSAQVLGWQKQFKGMNLLGCLLNTFIYIEIGGTGGSAFRPMYAQFLREAAPVVKKRGFMKAADLFEESGRAWSEIAAAALPDDEPPLGRIRGLMFEKNNLFENMPEGYLERMAAIKDEMNMLVKKALGKLSGGNVSFLLRNMKRKILKCREMEKKAFQELSENVF